MTKEDIIRMAREAGFTDADEKGVWITDGYWTEEMERFAALVAVQVEATWQNRYLKLMDLMQIREGQPNKPCCLAEREKFEKLIDELTNKSLHAQLNAVAAEREACAKVCERQWGIDGQHTANEFAAAIRARSKE
jgi:hypothetical protein